MKKILLFTLLLLNYFSIYAYSSVNTTGYRWRNDNGSETTATWKALKNTPIQITDLSPIRLRVELTDENVNYGASRDSNLQYSTDNLTFIDITDAASPFSYYTSSNLVNGESTTQQISTGTFSGGEINSTFAELQFTYYSGVYEMEYSIQPNSFISSSATYYFKVKEIDNLNSESIAILKYCPVPVAAPVAASEQIVTAGSKVSNLVAAGTNLKWYDSLMSQTPLDANDALSNGTYYVTQTLNCESLKTAVNVKLNGSSLLFAGGYITVPANVNSSSYTKEAWINVKSFYNTPFIFCDGNSNFAYVSFSGTITAENFSGSFEAPGVIDLNRWYHVAVSYDATSRTLILYKDGVEVGSQVGLGNPANMETIGSYLGIANFFDGIMDEVRIWDRALTQDEIQENMNCELSGTHPGLLAYYKFNQGVEGADNTAVTTLTDSSGNSNHGTLTDFDLSAIASNWIGTSIIQTGNTCTTLNLGDHNFDNSADIKVYPNPSSSAFYVDSNSAGTIEIFDILGKSIQTQKLQSGTTTLDLSSTPNGLYLLKVTTDNNKSKTVKLIKN
jgi:hypothetical protein